MTASFNLTSSPFPSIIEIEIESKESRLVSFVVKCDKWSREITVSLDHEHEQEDQKYQRDQRIKTKLYVPNTLNMSIVSLTKASSAKIIEIVKLSLGTTIEPLQVDPSNEFLTSAIHQQNPPFSTSYICIVPENHDKVALSQWILTRHILSRMGIVATRLSKSKYKLQSSNLNEIKDNLIATKLWPREDCQLLACILVELEGKCVMTCVLMQLLEWKYQTTMSRLLLIGDSRVPNQDEKKSWNQSLHNFMVEDLCKNQEVIVLDEKVVSLSKEGAKNLLILLGKTLNANFKSSGGKITATEEWPEFWAYFSKNFLNAFLKQKQSWPTRLFLDMSVIKNENVSSLLKPCHCCLAFRIMLILPIIDTDFDTRDLIDSVLVPISEQTYPSHLMDKVLVVTPLQLSSLSIASLCRLKQLNWNLVVLTKPESLVLVKLARVCNLDIVPKLVIFASEFDLFEQWSKNPRAIEMAMAQKFDWMDSGRKNKDSTVPILAGFQEFDHLSPCSVQHNVESRRLSLTRKQKSMISVR